MTGGGEASRSVYFFENMSHKRQCEKGTMGCSASKSAWRENGGREFEAALAVIEKLGGSAVRLIDARYLVELAEKGDKLRRRQDLPEEAFVALRQLRAMGEGPGASLRVVVVSYPWLQPDHPDPRGETLRLLARVLKAYIAAVGRVKDALAARK